MQASSHNVLVLREDHGAVRLLTLNRPEARNSLSDDMLRALADEIAAAGNDRTVRAVVITGAPPAFCAGHDLKEMTAHRADADKGEAAFEATMTLCSTVMQMIPACPKPVIAAVNGVATAAGCQIVAACDLAIASQHAQFCTPGVNIGLFCSTPAVPLARAVSRKHALEMLLTGDMVTAEKAVEIGLVNRAVAPEHLLDEALAFAAKIAGKSSEAIAIGKRAFYEQIDMPLARAYDHASRVMVENMLKADAAEGIGAFLEKRPPRWPSAQ